MAPSRHAALRRLAGWALALYVGAGVVAPVADAVVFHLGQVSPPVRPSFDDGLGARTLHGICLLGQHAPETLPPSTPVAEPSVPWTADRSCEIAAVPPRDTTTAGIPLSRAPPRT
jgi:hypothetical protein